MPIAGIRRKRANVEIHVIYPLWIYLFEIGLWELITTPIGEPLERRDRDRNITRAGSLRHATKVFGPLHEKRSIRTLSFGAWMGIWGVDRTWHD